jgi:hypothetical protein
MLDSKKIRQIVSEVASANLAPQSIDSVVSESATDSEGREALRITIVVAPDSVSRMKGDAVLDTLVQIQNRLREEGEERFPIVEYATKEELESSGDS